MKFRSRAKACASPSTRMRRIGSSPSKGLATVTSSLNQLDHAVARKKAFHEATFSLANDDASSRFAALRSFRARSARSLANHFLT